MVTADGLNKSRAAEYGLSLELCTLVTEAFWGNHQPVQEFMAGKVGSSASLGDWLRAAAEFTRDDISRLWGLGYPVKRKVNTFKLAAMAASDDKKNYTHAQIVARVESPPLLELDEAGYKNLVDIMVAGKSDFLTDGQHLFTVGVYSNGYGLYGVPR
ncbi:MAG: hypothetical protein FOGNACKC_00845 [Anaerolineae bacterium]|nr:hypothetical protein [Anaerolineae bacterium]